MGAYNMGGFEFTISCVTTCSGTPATGTASLTAADDCAATAGTIAIANAESGSGISYDWETSSDGSSGWTSFGGVYQSSIQQSPGLQPLITDMLLHAHQVVKHHIQMLLLKPTATVTSGLMKQSVEVFQVIYLQAPI